MNQKENGISISMPDMLAHILLHWKQVLIIGLAFAAVFAGAMSLHDYIEITNRYTDKTYAAMTEDLSAGQMEAVEQFYNRYLNYRARVDDNQYYIDNSAYMKLNRNVVSVFTREYIIHTDHRDIIASFTSSALDLDEYRKMADAIDADVDPGYVDELVSFTGSAEQESYAINTDKTGDTVTGSVANACTGLLTLRVMYNDRATCEKMVNIADEAIHRHFELLRSSGISAEMTVLTDAYTEEFDSSIADYQESTIEKNTDLMRECYRFAEDSRDILGEDGYKAFRYLIEKDQEPEERVLWLKWIMTGLAAGFLLSMIITLAGYFLNPGIKTPEEAYRLTGERGMGIFIQNSASKAFFGRLLDKLVKNIEFRGVNRISDREMLPLLCDRIQNTCERRNAKSIFIVTDTDKGYSKRVVDKMVCQLSEAGIVAKAGNPTGSLEALEGFRESEAAVIAITNKASLPNTIMGNEAVCRENNIPMIGSFIIYPM